MGAYEAATTLLYFSLGAAVLGAFTPSFGATLLVVAAYTTTLLSRTGINAVQGDAVALLMLGVVLYVVGGAASLVSHKVTRWVLPRRARRGARYYYE